MVSIARRNLFADIPRLLVAQAGIAFAVSLITLQLGVLQGFVRSTALVVENSPAELWVGSEEMVYWELTDSSLSTVQLEDLAAIAGIADVEPLFIASSRWNSDQSDLNVVRLLAVDPQGTLFQPGTVVSGDWETLEQPLTGLVDRSNLEALGLKTVGDAAELNLIHVQLGGIVRDSQSIASSAFVYLSLSNSYDYLDLPYIPADLEADTLIGQQGMPQGPVTYFLVDLEEGADVEAVSADIANLLPGYEAYPKQEVIDRTHRYWRDRTGVGFILGLGAVVGGIVGVAIVGQILYASVSDRIKDFGTLRAMGADDQMVYRIILQQAGWMAVLGYLPGIIICSFLSRWAIASQGVLILITPGMALGIFALTVGMCTLAAVFAIQKATRVDPGIVFRA